MNQASCKEYGEKQQEEAERGINMSLHSSDATDYSSTLTTRKKVETFPDQTVSHGLWQMYQLIWRWFEYMHSSKISTLVNIFLFSHWLFGGYKVSLKYYLPMKIYSWIIGKHFNEMAV